jgi:hypothetical protein
MNSPGTPVNPVNLPASIEAYFQADTRDADRVAHCFTERAVVIDERREYQGRTAIANWKAAATAKYHYTSEPIGIEARGAELTVTARLVGDFPGSPVNLQYHFTLEGDKIARLEITS